MKFWYKYKYQLGLLLLILVSFWRWFTPGIISHGDWYHINVERLAEYAFWPQVMEESYGVGSYLGLTLHSTPLRFVIGLTHQITQLDFSVLSIIFYYGFALLVTATGMWFLAKRYSQSNFVAFFASALYLFNSYALIIFTGGQELGAVGYGLVPFVVLAFDRLIRRPELSSTIILSFVVTLQILYDPRFLVFSIIGVIIWFLINPINKENKKDFVKYAGLSLILLVLLNSYWLYGLFGVHGSGGITLSGYDDIGWVSALSYSNFHNALALHHTWWPTVIESIKYEPFLTLYLLPFLALANLLFKSQRKSTIVLLLFLLLGVFLAKGSNEPNGQVYLWLFENFPGFKVFRDPAKFFTLIAFTYSLLVPMGTYQLYKYFKEKFPVAVKIFVGSVFVSLIIIPNLALFGQVIGQTFHKTTNRTAVQTALRDYTGDGNHILWVPRFYRYTLFSNKLATLDANTHQYTQWSNLPFIAGDVEVITQNPFLRYLLQTRSVEVVGLPADPNDDIYQYAKLNQQQFKRNWESTGLFEKVIEVVDEDNLTTYLLPTKESSPTIFSSKKLIVIDDSNSQYLKDNFSAVNANEVIFSLGENIPKEADQASLVILTPTHELSQINQGKISYNFHIPFAQEFNINYPEQSAGVKVFIDNQEHQRGSLTNLVAGDHQLLLDLTGANSSSGRIPSLANSLQQWASCSSESKNLFVVNARRSQQDSFTRVTAQNGLSACINYNLPPEDSKGLFILDIEGYGTDTKMSGNTSVGVEFVPRFGEDYNLPAQNARNFVSFGFTGDYDFLRVKVEARVDKDNNKYDAYINNMGLHKISTNAEQLDALVLQPTEHSFNGEVTDYQRINEVHWQFNLQNNTSGSLVSANLAYNSNWQLVHQETDQVIDDHFNASFGQNGWIVPANLNGQFDIVFKPAKAIYFSSFLSLLAFMASLIYLIAQRNPSYWREKVYNMKKR